MPSSSSWLSYIDDLQRRNSSVLAFYPHAALERALAAGQILLAEENGEPAGYLWHGPARPGRDVVVYQACIDYELRRQHLGYSLVANLIALGQAAGATGIRLRCASSAEANAFWQAAGFYVTAVVPGGVRRGRLINCYRTDISATLFTLPPVEAATSTGDWKAYRRLRRDGARLPSRFSRAHYPSRR